jgi:hypothetical protein
VGYHYFQVWLDGEQLPAAVYEDQPPDSFLSGIKGGPGHGNNGLAVELQFETHLVVKIRSSIDSPQTVFWASYTIEPTATTDPGEHFEEIDAVPHLFRQTSDGRVLVGPARWSRVTLRSDFWLPNEWIVGEVELHVDRALGEPEEAAVPLMLRPSGRSRRFEPIFTVGDVRGRAAFEIPPDQLAERRDLRGLLGATRDLELVADLPGYANYPAPLA